MSNINRPKGEESALLAGYRRGPYATYRLRMDVAWVTARKRTILRGALREALSTHLRDAAAAQDCEILHLDIWPNLCHLRLDCPPDMAPKIIVHRLKQYAAEALNKAFGAVIRKAPSLWTSRYLAAAEPVKEATLRAFLDTQPDR